MKLDEADGDDATTPASGYARRKTRERAGSSPGASSPCSGPPGGLLVNGKVETKRIEGGGEACGALRELGWRLGFGLVGATGGGDDFK